MARKRSKKRAPREVDNPEIRFVDVPGPRLELWRVDASAKSNSEDVDLAPVGSSLEGTIVRPVIQYAEGNEKHAREIARSLAQAASARGALHVYSPQFEPVRTDTRRDLGVDERTSPLEAVLAWCKARPQAISERQRDRVLGEVEEALRAIDSGEFSQARPRSFRVAYISATDYRPFQGRQLVKLPNGAVVVSARYAGERGRSNRAGKTALLGAVRHALFGGLAQSMVHSGCERATVEVGIDQGDARFVVQRSMKDGKGTVRLAMTEGKLARVKLAEADEYVRDQVGMTAGDFDRICYVNENDLHGVLGETDAAAKEALSRWFGLGGWDAVNKYLSDKLKEVDAFLSGKETIVATLRENVEREVPSPEIIGRLRGEIEKYQTARAEYQSVSRGNPNRLRDALERAEEAMRLRKRLAGTWPSDIRASVERLEADLAKATQAYGASREKAQAAQDLAEERRREIGKFSGVCPVDRARCPRAGEINENTQRQSRIAQEAAKAATAAHRKLAQAGKEREVVKLALERAREELREVLRQEQVVEAADEDGRSPDELREALRKMEEAGSELEELENLIADANGELAEALAVVRARNEALERLEQRQSELEKLRDEHRVLSLAVTATGRGGAPALQIEAAAARIETMANEVLEIIGTDHRLAFDFIEHLKRGADFCACGARFEGAQRKCPNCGEARPKATREKFQVQVVDGSGRHGFKDDSRGGKDLLAIAFRVAAARYLGAPVLLLDEVCGSLDAVNLERFARLVGALPKMGIEQVLVISHRSEVADAIGRRVEIVRYPEEGRSVVQWRD